MMKNTVLYGFRWWLVIGFFLLHMVTLGQSNKEKLQKNKESIQQEIKLTNKLLSETKKNKKASLNQLILLNKQIAQRKRLIDNIAAEIKYLDNSIAYNQKRISELENKLDKLKEEYARMIQAAYRNHHHMTRMMYVFASDNFNQAIKRLQYFRQYSNYRREQSFLILSTQDSIQDKNSELLTMRKRKVGLKSKQELEKTNMMDEKVEKNNTIQKLSTKEKELIAELKKKERAAAKLQRAIEKAIADEIAKAEVKSKETATSGKKTTVKRTFELTPDQVKLSDKFSSNKGRLPWPSKSGIVSSTFGEHPHPVLKYIKTKNNGVDILTSEGEEARSVFDGVVSQVIDISSGKKALIIRHGEYLSVYSNLKNVFVQKGQNVKTKQSVGVISTDSGEGKTELHFEIWKGKALQNPAYWLAK